MSATIALAGRLIDAPAAEVMRFPLESIPCVKRQVRELFAALSATAVVCSAACGGDLIALGVAHERAMGAYIILPFDDETFRRTSVVDRPGNWGPRYDHAIARARAEQRLEILESDTHRSPDAAYAAASDRILARALELAGDATEVVAVAVWEGHPRGAADLTWRLLREAEHNGITTRSVLTVPNEAIS
jgi:hypothetical protein